MPGYSYPPSTGLVLDLDMRAASTAAGTALFAAAGFTTLTGAAHRFDSTLGFNGGGSSDYRYTGSTPSWVTNVANSTEFTVLLDVRRVDIAKDVTANTSAQNDSEGIPKQTGTATPINFDSNAGFFYGVSAQYLGTSSGAASTNLILLGEASDGVSKSCQMAFNSHHSPVYDDPDGFVTLGWSCEPGAITWLVDGWPLVRETVAASWTGTPTAWVKGAVGSAGGALFHDGWIRRLRIYNKAVRFNYSLHPKVGVFGDSFMQRATDRALPASDSVADINAAQNELSDTTSIANSGTNKHWSNFHAPNITCHIMQRWAVRSGLPPFRVFNSGHSGHGWAADVNPIEQAYLDTLITWSPEIIICGGSVNDASATAGVADVNYLRDVKLMLDQFIDGLPNLRKILFVTSVSVSKLTASYSAAQIAKLALQAHLQLQLSGYRNKVKVINTYHAFGGANYDGRLQLGQYPRIVNGAGIDVHPGGFGMLQYAEKIWPHLLEELTGRPKILDRHSP